MDNSCYWNFSNSKLIDLKYYFKEGKELLSLPTHGKRKDVVLNLNEKSILIQTDGGFGNEFDKVIYLMLFNRKERKETLRPWHSLGTLR